MSAGQTIPLLQDTAEEDVWTTWGIEWRDVVIVDENNEVVGVYNLTDHNLVTPANFNTLKTLLTEAAGGD